MAIAGYEQQSQTHLEFFRPRVMRTVDQDDTARRVESLFPANFSTFLLARTIYTAEIPEPAMLITH